MSEKTVLITGASSGIGFELAKIFAEEGFNLILIARDKSRLEQAAKRLGRRDKSPITTLAKDLSSADSAEQIYKQLKKSNLQVDILINNAGFATYGFFADIDWSKDLAQMQLNMVTLTGLTKFLVKDMVKKKEGKILNIASTAAFQPGPLMAVYYASKAYVLSFSLALASELNGTGVTVTVLCPGPTRTSFADTAGLANTRLFKWGVMEAKAVAWAGYKGLMAGKKVVIPGVKNKILVWLRRFVPYSLAAEIAKKLQS